MSYIKYRSKNKEKEPVWHMEDTERCTALCMPNSPYYRPTSAGKNLTDNWTYVTCPKCLAMKPKEEKK